MAAFEGHPRIARVHLIKRGIYGGARGPLVKTVRAFALGVRRGMGDGSRIARRLLPEAGKGAAMDAIIGNVRLYALAAFGAGFLLALIACARPNG